MKNLPGFFVAVFRIEKPMANHMAVVELPSYLSGGPSNYLSVYVNTNIKARFLPKYLNRGFVHLSVDLSMDNFW